MPTVWKRKTKSRSGNDVSQGICEESCLPVQAMSGLQAGFGEAEERRGADPGVAGRSVRGLGPNVFVLQAPAREPGPRDAGIPGGPNGVRQFTGAVFELQRGEVQ